MKHLFSSSVRLDVRIWTKTPGLKGVLRAEFSSINALQKDWEYQIRVAPILLFFPVKPLTSSFDVCDYSACRSRSRSLNGPNGLLAFVGVMPKLIINFIASGRSVFNH